MATPPWRWLVVLAVAALVVVVARMAFPRAPEPGYQGKRLGYWLSELVSPLSALRRKEEARQAILALGTNALPFLTSELDHRPSFFWLETRVLARQVAPRWLPPDEYRPSRAQLALQAFQVLGEGAAPAIPVLARQLTNNAHRTPNTLAAVALGKIGAPALPALLEASRHTNPYVRGGVVSALCELGEVARPAVPRLLELYATETNGDVRRGILTTLGEVDPEARAKLTTPVALPAPSIVLPTGTVPTGR